MVGLQGGKPQGRQRRPGHRKPWNDPGSTLCSPRAPWWTVAGGDPWGGRRRLGSGSLRRAGPCPGAPTEHRGRGSKVLRAQGPSAPASWSRRMGRRAPGEGVGSQVGRAWRGALTPPFSGSLILADSPTLGGCECGTRWYG